ncbi:MAG: CHRD domain-containing protein [Mariniphaga sp.]|nr:CHRD domain-containing protein [Mariniphaga sp.]
MKTIFSTFVLLLTIVIGISSCKKSDTVQDSNIITFKATLNGASETPTNASMATGSATYTYDKTTYILTGTLTFTGITPSAGHIHKGAVGVAGGVIFPLTAGTVTSPLIFTSPVLDVTQRTDLMAGLYYINLHTAAFPGGEIRGQLVQQTTVSSSGSGY